MPQKDGLLRICCLASSEGVVNYTGLQSVSWGITGRARVVTAIYRSPEARREYQRADLVYLDCFRGEFDDAKQIEPEIPGETRFVCYSEADREQVGKELAILDGGLRGDFETWLSKQVKVPAYQPPKLTLKVGDLDLNLLLTSIGLCLGPVIEMYFPDQSGRVNVDSVGGGLSGTPLVRIEFSGRKEQYYLKFFKKASEFKTEWNGQESATEWLGDLTVKLKPVPDVVGDAEGQCRAISGLNNRMEAIAKAEHREFCPYYPICFPAARYSKTLKGHYQADAGDTPPKKMYEEVVRALRTKNEAPAARPARLSECLDYGPGSPRDPYRTILLTLRSDEYVAFIKHLYEDLKRLKGAYNGEVDWSTRLVELLELLTGTPPERIEKQYQLYWGNIHGDANSRNFLVSENPARVQVIDCGCHADNAPLLFDPPQLESDLKVNLMATEEASGHEEIDLPQLPEWIKMERLSIKQPFGFDIPEDLPESVKRAYEIVQVIRKRVKEISPKDGDGDPDPHPYFFFLLYCTLRKLRNPAVPPTKRLFALASVFLLLEELNK